MFDVAEKKAEKIFAKTSGKLTKTPKMIILQRLLQFIERRLTLKHGSEEIVELPKSEKAWSRLSDQYGGDPIMVARRQDNSKMVLIIMDTFGAKEG